jgi:HSP20 family protein
VSRDGERSGGAPDLELTETGDGWEVIVRLPGVAPEEVAVELDDRELRVRARSEAEVNADQGLPGGFQTRGFEHRVELPAQADPDGIDAVMDHGLLRVRLPRAPRPPHRTITVARTGPHPDQLPAPGTTAAPGPATEAGAGTGPPVPPDVPTADPAADREMHHPEVAVADLTRRRTGGS